MHNKIQQYTNAAIAVARTNKKDAPGPTAASAMMEAYIAMADALANSIHQTVSLFDASTMKFIYISPTPDSRQNKYRELALRQSLGIYQESIPCEERRWLRMAHQQLQPIVARMDAEERKYASLTQKHHYILPEDCVRETERWPHTMRHTPTG